MIYITPYLEKQIENMVTLPTNSTSEDCQKYLDSFSREQLQLFHQDSLIELINAMYTCSVDRVIEDEEPASGAMASGKFVADGQYFDFQLIYNGSKFTLMHQPVKQEI